MTSSQWLDLAILAVAFVAAISGWRTGALGSLLSFVRGRARRRRGNPAGSARGQPHRRAAHQVVRRAVPDPRPRRDRRDRGCGAGPCRARGDPQPGAAQRRLVGRGGVAGRRDPARRVGAGHPADVLESTESRCGSAWLAKFSTGVDQVAPELGDSKLRASCEQALRHLRAARRAAAVRPHPERQRRRPGRGAWPPTRWSRPPGPAC